MLCAVADVLARGTRLYDLAARLGGDEFCVMLPGTDQRAADGYVAKTLQMLETEMAQHRWPVSFSVGVATCRPVLGNDPAALIEGASQALHRARQDGRNRVSI